MSLRTFHITFVSICSLLMIFIMIWAINHQSEFGDASYMGYAYFSAFGLIIMILYTFKFISFYNNAFNIKTKFKFNAIIPPILAFMLPPILFITYKDRKKSKNEIISALIGVTFYLVLVFGYLSYFIEKNSLNEYKEQLKINAIKN